MYKPADMSLWQGRVDNEEATPALRWHQTIAAWGGQIDLHQAPTLLGFACDEGVRRNQGRTGARNGPGAIRHALTNVAYHQPTTPFDAGDVYCEDQNLEQAQALLAEHVANILAHNGRPVILGGGHEMAWGSFLGISHYLTNTAPNQRIGIINFDAHFDLRNPHPQGSSGTPFRQIAQWCETNNQPFHYLALGVNPAANTTALFEFAKQHNVGWIEDVDCTADQLKKTEETIAGFLKQIDELYLTICLDVFAVQSSPGVSAPTALGIDPIVAIKWIRAIKRLCQQHKVTLRLADIAEMNPTFDPDNRTAKLAARLVHEIVSLP